MTQEFVTNKIGIQVSNNVEDFLTINVTITVLYLTIIIDLT